MNATEARAEAIKLELKTYQGKPCKYGHNGQRYVSTSHCVACQCHPRRPEEEISPLGKASTAWTDLQRENPHTAPHILWPRFLAAIKDDPAV